MQAYPYPAPQQRRGLSTGCLVTIAIVLTLAAVAVCAALAWFIPGSPLPTLLGARAALAPTSAAVPAPTIALAPTVAAAPTGAPLPTLPPSNLGPRAITLQNVGQLTETHEITGAVLGPVAYSPDGKTLAVGVSNVISLRAAESLEEFDPPRRLEGHTGSVFTLAWSPDSQMLASGAMDENTIRLWNMSDGKVARELKGHTGWIRAVAFAPDGKTLASGSIDRTVRLWDVSTGTVIWTFSGHTDFIGTVAFTPDGKAVASSSSDGTVRLWDVTTGQQRAEFSYKTPLSLTANTHLRATGLSFTKDGKTAAIGL